MTHEEYTKKLIETLSKMPNTLEDSKEKYNRSALFNKAVNSIVHGADPHTLVGQLIDIIENVQKEYSNHIEKCPMRAGV